MNQTVARVLAATAVAVFAVGASGMVLIALVGGQTSSQQWVAVSFAVYAAVGYLLTTRRPANPIGWLALATALIGGIFGLAQSLQAWAELEHLSDPVWSFILAWPQNWLWLPLVLVSTTLPLLLLPDGRLLSPRWRWVVGTAIFITSCYVVVNAFAPTVGIDNAPNPISPPFMAGIGDQLHGLLATVDTWLSLAFLATIVAAVVSLVLRVRRARGVEQVQLRWILFGGACLATAFIVGFSLPPPWGDWLLTLGMAMFPLTMGVAILRYRLYDIDRVISRTVSYAIVTGAALGTYAVIVTSASRLLPSGSSPIVVAGATLAAAALVRPLLRRVQGGVDRRFNRSRYDAAATVDEFGLRLRGAVDVDATVGDLLDVVQRTMAPSSVGLARAGDTVER